MATSNDAILNPLNRRNLAIPPLLFCTLPVCTLLASTLLCPCPIDDIVGCRPAVSVDMNSLLTNIEIIFHKIQVIHVDQPNPRGITFTAKACRTVPLRFLPILKRLFFTAGLQRLLEVVIYCDIAVVAGIIKIGGVSESMLRK
ncbi:hypothetical protein J3492_10920 [Psychrobacter sp. F1192]|uniref:Uncharacterized protein n=1 Tax=Psychrobacter coccoides TaxID=2818440 RepID=A0ABS3NRQ4_9GAMM|nr:hypothetical protein [Psychrobacter coccoides]MBO1531719.1 hypothetical protein [Psychrobacter coccoides]